MLLKHLKKLLLLLILWAFGSIIAPDEASFTRSMATLGLETLEVHTLSNGLKVLLYPQARSPELTVNMVYKTGARHESAGEYGMAHLLEHLLYKGTRRFPELPAAWEKRGARFNANTNADRTTYYASLPFTSDNLEFALAVEADSMHSAELSDAAIQAELQDVLKEWEKSGQSGFQPLLKEMLALAYPQHAYGRDTLGIQEGLLQSRLEQVRDFYQRYYGPNCAVLSISGPLDVKRTLGLVQKYFAPLAPITDAADEPALAPAAQHEAKEIVLSRPQSPDYIGVLYRAMSAADSQYVAAQALVHCLSSGPDSLLQKALVDSGLAKQVFGFVQQSAAEGFLAFMARPQPGRDPVKLVQELSAILENAAHSCQTADLLRFQKENQESWAELVREPRALTMQLAEYEVFGDWRLLLSEHRMGQTLVLQDLHKAARWITARNRTAGVLNSRAVLASP